MGDFIEFIESISLGVYFICGFFLIWNLRSLMIARGEQHVARYQLEREFADRRGGRSLTIIILMAEILIFIWATTTLASPAWSEALSDNPSKDTDSPRSFQTSTAAREGSFDIEAVGGPTDILIPRTAAPPSAPTGTIRPSDQREGCDISHAYIEYPVNGMVVSQYETVHGTASLDDFSKYRFEIKSANSDTFSVISNDARTPVIEGPLGAIEPFNLIPGEYRFRLVVFDTNNQMLAHCEITIWIEDAVPTATPTVVGGPANTTEPEGTNTTNGTSQ